MEVVKNKGYILTDDALKDFEHWYKCNVNYHPYKDMDSVFWELPNYIKLNLINIFFDHEKIYIDTQLNGISCLVNVSGQLEGIFKDRLSALSEGIIIANARYNFSRWIDKVRWVVKNDFKLKMTKDEIENAFSKTTMETFYCEGLTPTQAVKKELEFWADAPK